MRVRLLAFALLTLVAAPALAQDPNYSTQRTSAPLPPTVTFRNAPSWTLVPGTNVSIVAQDQRPTYDMFSFNRQYYIYNDGYWYRSDLVNGPYTSLELNAIPPEFRAVPRSSWVSYPAGWSDAATTGTGTGMATASDWAPTINFDTAPHWENVPGSSRVSYVKKSMRPADYDLFRYDSRYYTFQRNNWYSSPSVNGPYTLVESANVPMAFRTVKKNHWVSYPSGWSYMTPGAYNQTIKVKTETK